MRMLLSGRQDRRVARSADAAQQPRMLPLARAKRALLQPEPSPLHIGAEILAFRHGIVTGLLLAPAVLFRLAEADDIALSAVGEDAIAPLVVGAHLLVRGIGVAVAMHREAERQPRRDKRRRGPYADAEARHPEPRDILIVEDAAIRARINALLKDQDWIPGCPHLLVFLGNNRRPSRRLLQRDGRCGHRARSLRRGGRPAAGARGGHTFANGW